MIDFQLTRTEKDMDEEATHEAIMEAAWQCWTQLKRMANATFDDKTYNFSLTLNANVTEHVPAKSFGENPPKVEPEKGP